MLMYSSKQKKRRFQVLIFHFVQLVVASADLMLEKNNTGYLTRHANRIEYVGRSLKSPRDLPPQ